MATIYRPCACTREEVKRALDVKQAAYADQRVDRAILAATEEVETICQRSFHPTDTTRSFDWPNYQYAYPWRLWLDHNEMAAQPTLFVSGSLMPTPFVIPTGSYTMQPINYGPPFTYIELRRDKDVAFGYNDTPQLDIAITGTFGFWLKTKTTGTLTAAIQLSDTTVQVSDSFDTGVGDVLIVDSERMIVTDSGYADTTISYSGLSTAQANDNQVSVANGSLFTAGEVLLVDSEWILVQSVIGNSLNVKRAWDGSILSAHTGGTIWARRLLSVLRGQLGTVTATHLNGASLNVLIVPGLVKQTAIAEAIVALTQEPVAYGGGAIPTRSTTALRTGGSPNENPPGIGLYDIRNSLAQSTFTRKARSRVI
jgi:hypothetical protein